MAPRLGLSSSYTRRIAGDRDSLSSTLADTCTSANASASNRPGFSQTDQLHFSLPRNLHAFPGVIVHNGHPRDPFPRVASRPACISRPCESMPRACSEPLIERYLRCCSRPLHPAADASQRNSLRCASPGHVCSTQTLTLARSNSVGPSIFPLPVGVHVPGGISTCPSPPRQLLSARVGSPVRPVMVGGRGQHSAVWRAGAVQSLARTEPRACSSSRTRAPHSEPEKGAIARCQLTLPRKAKDLLSGSLRVSNSDEPSAGVRAAKGRVFDVVHAANQQIVDPETVLRQGRMQADCLCTERNLQLLQGALQPLAPDNSTELDLLREGLADLERRLVSRRGADVDQATLSSALAVVHRGLAALERNAGV